MEYPRLLLKGIKSPKKVPLHLRRQYSDRKRRLETHPGIVDIVANITGAKETEVTKYYEELSSDHSFLTEVLGKKNFIGMYGCPENALAAYLTTRIIEPDIVVETGVYTGTSSAFFLRALERNRNGELYSIDLPGTESDPVIDESSPYHEVEYTLPDESEVGRKIPNHLKSRWNLYLGRSDEHLAPLLEELRSVDLFMHDSDHSYENMMFEFEAVLPYLSKGGVILADDVDWNEAMADFVTEHDLMGQSLAEHIPDKWMKQVTIVGAISAPDRDV